MKQRHLRRRILPLSSFVPLLALPCLLMQRGIFPFGEESFLRTDPYHQYAPFSSESQYKLQHGGSLLYNWDTGLEVNFMAVYAYYLASLLNWFVVLFPRHYMIGFVMPLIVVEIVLSSVSMTYYLLRHSSRGGLLASVFGILYAFPAYMIAYSWNVMWLDCIVLFPLILLGTEKMVRGESFMKYILCLDLGAPSNHYIPVTICLFLVLYVVFQAITAELGLAETGEAALHFAIASLITAELAAVVLLPETFAPRLTTSGKMNFPKAFESCFPIVDVMAHQLPFVECEIGLDHQPDVYCGIFTLRLLLLYLSSHEVPVKQRMGYALFLLSFFTSFSVNMLDYIWRGFHYPSSPPARQGSIFCFPVLYFSFQALERLLRFSPREIFLNFATVVLFILFAERLVTEEHFHLWVFYLTFLLAALYGLIFRSYMVRQFVREFYFCMPLVLVTLESTLDLAYTGIPTTSRTECTADSAGTRLLKKSAPETPFIRFKRYERRSKDDGTLLNFRSASLSNSTVNKPLTDFLRSVSCEISANAYSVTGFTPFVDMLLNVGHGFVSDERCDESQERIRRSGSTVLIKDPDTLPLGFVAEYDFIDSWSYTFENPADAQNSLCNLFNMPPVPIAYSTKPNDNQESMTMEQDGLYFAFAISAKANKIKFLSDGKDKTFNNLKRRYLMELGYRKAGETLGFSKISDDKPESSAIVYRFNFDVLKELQQAVLKHEIQVDSYTGNTVSTEVETEGPSLLFTSIPYDKGWTVHVNRRSAKAEKAMGVSPASRVPNGQYHIYFRYSPEGLKLSAFISFLSLLALAFFWRFKKGYEQRFRWRVTKRYEVLYQEIQEASLRMRAESLAAQQMDAEQAIEPIMEPEEPSTAVSSEAAAEESVQLVNFGEL